MPHHNTRCFICLTAAIVIATARPQGAWALPTVYTSQSSFLSATTPDQTSDFNALPFGGLGNPFSYEGVNYETKHPSNGALFGTFVRSTPGGTSNHGLANNSTPDMTLTFDAGPAKAIGYYITPALYSAGVWEMTLTLTNATTFVDTFSHDNSRTTEYRGYIEPAGIESIRIARPPGQFSPNHRIDDLSLTFVPEPSSLALTAMALFGLAGRRRRRN